MTELERRVQMGSKRAASALPGLALDGDDNLIIIDHAGNRIALGGGGGSSGGFFSFQQTLAASEWDVTHGLGYHPSVTIVDSGGSEIEGSVEHLDINSVRLIFSAPFSGNAYFS